MARLSLVWAAALSAQGAEIYKWVDQDGRTHYSQKKDGGTGATAVEVKVTSAAPAAAPAPSTPTAEVKAFREQLEAQKKRASLNAAVPPEPPRSLSGGKTEETPTGKCNLARDILSGAAVRRNVHKPIDAYDRQIAESDVRLFCKN